MSKLRSNPAPGVRAKEDGAAVGRKCAYRRESGVPSDLQVPVGVQKPRQLVYNGPWHTARRVWGSTALRVPCEAVTIKPKPKILHVAHELPACPCESTPPPPPPPKRGKKREKKEKHGAAQPTDSTIVKDTTSTSNAASDCI